MLTIFGMWGGPQDAFLSFEFRVDRSPNFGATGGQNRPFPSLIQQLVATAQAVIWTGPEVVAADCDFLLVSDDFFSFL